MTDKQIARALGYASIGLGLVEFLAPKTVSQQLGIKKRPLLLRTLGAREMASGVAILRKPHSRNNLRGGLWSRVAGDAVDLALLGAAARRTARLRSVGIVAALVLGITALDYIYAKRLRRRDSQREPSNRARMRTVTHRAAHV